MAADQPPAKAGKQVQPKKAKKAGKKATVRTAPAAGKGRVSHSIVLSRDEAAAYVEAIVSGLRSGSIRFRQGERRVVLRPAGQLTLSIKARDGGKKEGFAFEISWRQEEAGSAKDAPAR